jgi:hypothetical protein
MAAFPYLKSHVLHGKQLIALTFNSPSGGKPMVSNPQLSLKPSVGVPTAAGIQSNFLQQLQSALAGGTPVYNFFSSYHQTLQTFFTMIATADDNDWLEGTDEKGNPVIYVQIGNNFFTLSANITNTDPITNGTGTNYEPVGVATVTVTINNFGTHTVAVHDLIYAGFGIGGVGIGAALPSLVRAALQVYRFYSKAIAKAVADYLVGNPPQPPPEAEAAGTDIDSDAASQAALDAFLAPTLSVDISVGAVAGAAGGAVLILLMAVLQLTMVDVRDYVQFYNVTSQDIQFGIGYLPWGNVSCNGPAPVGQTATIKAVGSPPTVPGIIPSGTVMNYALITMDNSGSGDSIGYVLEATPFGDFPGFRTAVYVAGDGSNTSLYLAFTNDDCNDFWQQFDPPYQGEAGTGQTTLTMRATSGNYTLSIALNQLNGQSASPLDGTMGYNFEHLIVLTDGSISLS